MWDNNIVSTSSKVPKHQKIDHYLTNRIISNSFQHNTVYSTIIFPSVVKNKKSKIKSADILLKSKHRNFTVPSLPLHNRIVISSDRLGYKVHESYRLNHKTR